jgi:pimeloyl-ACP methyl ester carboxylesterase
MTDYVLVHGAWAGGWSHEGLAQDLRDAGHRAVVVHLKGLGLRRDEAHGGITLSDHIEDVCAAVAESGFDRFVLAGHSYGGMVITGAATRLGARIDALIYLDAFLPQDEQSLWDITGEYEHKHYIDTQKFTPGMVAPIIGGLGGKLSRQPLLTLLEAVRFTGEEAKIKRHIYVLATGWQPSPFPKFAARIAGDPAWELHEADCGHDVMNGQREQVLAILLGAG